MEQACTFDLTNDREVIQHIRDLLNLAPLLEWGIEEELRLFIKRLKEVGWGDEKISEMMTYAGYGNRFERMKDNDGKPLLPRAIPSRGDQSEWRRIKSLHQK